MIKIDTGKLAYYSQLDEKHFFNWANEIPCVVSVEGGVLHIDPADTEESNLRDLMALLFRYQLPMSKLSQLLNEKNKSWLLNENAYWYSKVFKSI